MSPIIIYSAVFLGVAALVGALAFISSGDREAEVEERLSALTASKSQAKDGGQYKELLTAMRADSAGTLEKIVSRYLNLRMLFEQANVSLTVPKFLATCGALAAVGIVLPMVAGFNVMLGPVMAATLGFLPLLWLQFKRKRRLKKFAAQLPEALELIARALRAGHSLAAGFSLVAQEMSNPIGMEFNRTFEEQNLGKPLDEALTDLTKRIPNLDLKFFATAIVLQRQTGGDLAEILDKIGYLVRERFKIWGQVQALTGEGRLSGIVLLALPPALFAVVYHMNPSYLMVLFTDPLGKKMLIGGIVTQLLGALLIRKIVNIRV
ncbi:MAG TPA: type II secretion system F family protein [Lacipirellulaceae bacterium]|jgi:tight adherence protein B|nr:type II secretion system F family protein [Lacipirellulaceae bacterium]